MPFPRTFKIFAVLMTFACVRAFTGSQTVPEALLRPAARAQASKPKATADGTEANRPQSCRQETQTVAGIHLTAYPKIGLLTSPDSALR